MTENQPPRLDAARAAQATTRFGTPPPQRALIGGRYELGDLIGEGGAARVHYARDTVLDRVVAVKLLRDEWSADPDFVARFYREARAVASLSHPNIIDIYDYGAHEQTYFIAMQLVEGTDLKSILRQEGRLPPTRAISFADGLLRGLGAAHERGIVHRDVKPQNVLVSERDGQVKLTDFGVARALSASQNTAAGTTVGTAHYMAPEQASGAAVGPATDLYAVGVVLFEALTGRLPFDGESALEIAIKHVREPVPSLAAVAPDVPPALARVIERALAKEPADRFPNAEAMRLALHGAVGVAGTATGVLHPAANGAAHGAQTRPLPPPSTDPPPPAALARPQRTRSAASRATGAGCFLPLLGLLIVALLVATVVLARSLVAQGTPTATLPVAAASPSSAAGLVPTATVIAPTGTPPPPPTNTVAPPTAPPVVLLPSATPIPPTATSEPPTATAIPPTEAPVPPTATAVPPTATPRPPTATPVPPTATPRPPAPTPTPQQGNGNGNGNGNGGQGQGPPLRADDIRVEQLQGAYRRDDGRLYGQSAVALYGSGTSYSTGTVTFRAANVPSGNLSLVLVGLDDERDARCQLQVVLNGTTIFDGPDTFPNTPTNDNGVGGGSRYWGQMTIRVPAGTLREGANTLVLRNRTAGSNIGIPYILISDVTFSDGR